MSNFDQIETNRFENWLCFQKIFCFKNLNPKEYFYKVIFNSKTLKKSYNLLVSIIEEINKDVSKKYKNSSLINDKMITKKKLPKKYNLKVISRTKCEPFMSKRNLYRDLSKDLLTKDEFLMFNLLYYGDGIKIKDISNIVGFDPSLVFNKAVFLEKHKLIHLKK